MGVQGERDGSTLFDGVQGSAEGSLGHGVSGSRNAP